MANVEVLGLELDSRGAEAGLDRVKAKSRDAGAEFGRTEKAVGGLNKAAKVLGVTLGAAVVFSKLIGELKAATAAALEFSKAMAEVSTLLPDTDDLEEVSRQVRQLSVEFNQAPVDQARAMYQVISAGARDAAEAGKILEVANRLAVGGVTDVATAADGLTSLLNAYGLAAGEAGNVSDALFVAMRAGKTTVGELSAGLGMVAPLAAQVGVGIDELAASVAALTKGGITTRISIAGLRAIMAAIVKPTSEAVAEAARLGIQFNSTALETQGLAGFMNTLVTATGGSTDSLAQLFGGVEALVPALALAGQAGTDLNAILGSMETKAGATGEAFDKVASSDAYRLEKAMGELKDMMIDVGNAILIYLVPAMELVADKADEAVDAVRILLALGRQDFVAAWQGLKDMYETVEDVNEVVLQLPPPMKETADHAGDLAANFAKVRESAEWTRDAVDAINKALAEGSTQVFEYRVDMAMKGRSFGMVDSVHAAAQALAGEVVPVLDTVADTSRDWGQTLDDSLPALEAGAQGLLSMGDALDLLDQGTRDALRGVLSLVDGIQALRAGGTANIIGGALGIGGGIAGIVSGLFGGDDESKRMEHERNRLLADNNQRLYEMTQALVGQGTTPGGYGDAALVAKALSDFATSGSTSFGHIKPGGELFDLFSGGGTSGGLADIFDSLGVSVESFMSLVEKSGIDVLDSAGRVIPGALDQLVTALEGMGIALTHVQQKFDDELEVRLLLAQGMDEEADALRVQLRYQKELAEARALGLDVTKLLAVQEAELAKVTEEVAKVVIDLIAKFADFRARAYSALGFGEEAGAIRRDMGYRAELGAEGLSEGDRQIIQAIWDGERAYDQRQKELGAAIDLVELNLAATLDSLKAQEEAVRANLDTTLEGLDVQIKAAQESRDSGQAAVDVARAEVVAIDDQISLARQSLQVAEEQLRTQESIVSATRQVVESLSDFAASLKLGGQSTLSPTAKLVEARAQYESMLGAARGGDLTAAGGLPGAAKALLDASRVVNASTTRYASDYEYVQGTIGAITARFAGQLSAEEQTLATLQGQASTIQAQLTVLDAQKTLAEANLDVAQTAANDARAAADEQIALLREAKDKAREDAQLQIDSLRVQADQARSDAETTIAQLQADAAKANLDAVHSLLALIDLTQIANELKVVITDPPGGSQSVIITEPIVAAVQESTTEARANVRVNQAGFAENHYRLERLEAAILDLRTGVRRLEETR